MIQITDENVFVFMQDNVLCHTSTKILELLVNIRFQSWSDRHNYPISTPLKIYSLSLRLTFTNGSWSCSIIP